MELKNKTLLLMGGGAYAKDIQRYKEEKGFRIVALGRDSGTPIAKISDAFYQVDTQDVDRVCEVVREQNVDGIFVGSSEVNISPAITNFVLNVICYSLGFKFFGKDFIIYSAVASVSFSAFYKFFEQFEPLFPFYTVCRF